VLRLLREHKLYSKLKKCSLFHTQIHYLGYVVSKEGLIMESKNIKAILEWPTMNNLNEVRSFMALVGY